LMLLVVAVCASVGNGATEYEDVPWDEESGPSDAVASKTIMTAVDQGEWEEVKSMIASGKYDLDVKNEYQETALHMCSAPHNPQHEVLTALIKAGAQLDPQDADGCTPLVWAVHNNHYENAKALLDAGANALLLDVKGRTAKEHAISKRMRELFMAPGEEPDSSIQDLTAGSFKTEVLDHEHDVIIYMYSPGCGHCREFAPTFDELAAGLRMTSLKFLKMDVTKGNPPDAYAVANLPTVMYSKRKPSEGAARPAPSHYEGDRTVKSLIAWIQKTASNKIMFMQGDKEAAPPESFEQPSDSNSEHEADEHTLHTDPPKDGEDEL